MINKIRNFLFSVLLTAASTVPLMTNVYAEETLKAEINVSSNTDTKIVIEYTDDAPKPEKSEITVSAGKKASFEILVYDPGTYTYTIKQSGTDKNSKLDKSIYKVELFVTIDSNGKLHYDVYASKDGGKSKTSEITFKNEIVTPTPTPTVTPSPTPKPNNIEPSKGTANDETAGLYYLTAVLALSIALIAGRVIIAYQRKSTNN